MWCQDVCKVKLQFNTPQLVLTYSMYILGFSTRNLCIRYLASTQHDTTPSIGLT